MVYLFSLSLGLLLWYAAGTVTEYSNFHSSAQRTFAKVLPSKLPKGLFWSLPNHVSFPLLILEVFCYLPSSPSPSFAACSRQSTTWTTLHVLFRFIFIGSLSNRNHYRLLKQGPEGLSCFKMAHKWWSQGLIIEHRNRSLSPVLLSHILTSLCHSILSTQITKNKAPHAQNSLKWRFCSFKFIRCCQENLGRMPDIWA